MHINEYRWDGTPTLYFGGMGLHGFPMPNIVRGWLFIVSKDLLFVLQIEYNEPKQAKPCERFEP